MRRLKSVWKSMFDIREGELAVTVSMALYLLFGMFAYYVLKPVSRAMFLSEFKVDKLPYLNMLIAAGGGSIAYLYSKYSVRASLSAAVTWTMSIAAVCLAGFWWITGLKLHWMLYVFNVWVSLFSAIVIAQGWLVAANLFDSRSAKRLYGLLGLGCVLGAAFGGAFTAFTAKVIGARNLLWAAVVLVGLAWASFRLAVTRKGRGSAQSRVSEHEPFTVRNIFGPIASSRHLRLLVAIMSLTFIVGTLVDFQFQAAAAATFKGRNELTAFFGRFQGIYINAITLPLQFFLTAAVLRRIGIGGTLTVMPGSILAASGAIMIVPGLGSAMAAELAESATRYTVNRTAMELLYLPLPAALRNRVKAFVDVFVDRMSRGIGGALLAVLLAAGFRDLRQIAVVSAVLCGVWLFLCILAQREYVQTVRDRIARRRLDLDAARIAVSDPATIRLLEQTARSAHPRPACYAVSLLAEIPDYDLTPLLEALGASPMPEVRGKVYEVAWFVRFDGLLAGAMNEIRSGVCSPALGPAVEYALAFAKDPTGLAEGLLGSENFPVAESVVRALKLHPGVAEKVLTARWIEQSAGSADARTRRLAALAIEVRAWAEPGRLEALLADHDPGVVSAACMAAAAVGDRVYLKAVAGHLDDPRIRRSAIEALSLYGAEVVGTLGDLLLDDRVPLPVRRQLPRALRLLPNQRSVNVLLECLGHADIPLRASSLRALNSLRERAPELNYGQEYVTGHVLNEARHYFELHAALAPLASVSNSRTATGLLARTLEHRSAQTVERLFHLLGLRYPQREMEAAYHSLKKSRTEEAAAALELLENVLEHSLRRVVLPLLDSPGAAAEKGQRLFGILPQSTESAIRELIGSRDPWLSACAIASAGEQSLRHLVQDIQAAAVQGGREVGEVARAAVATLAR